MQTRDTPPIGGRHAIRHRRSRELRQHRPLLRGPRRGLDAGHRVITYDRRGFGKSSQPTVGYDYDTFSADLNTLMETLDLRDAVLVGFSMGTGEVTRYLGTHGSGRVSKAALLATVPPFLLKTDDNPQGVPGEVFEGLKEAIRKDRPASQKSFLDDFSNVDKFMGNRISEQAWQQEFIVAVGASAIGTLRSVDSWLEDFRDDISKIDVPVLLIQGTEDRILPIDATARRLPGLIDDLHFIEIEHGPHNICWTHPEEVNRALLDFIAGREPAAVGEAEAVAV